VKNTLILRERQRFRENGGFRSNGIGSLFSNFFPYFLSRFIILSMKMKRKKSLIDEYPASRPCSCETCRGYCMRPGWWTVDQAGRAITGGYAGRMMLEMSRDRSFGVLSPAFKGCEQAFAMDLFSNNGCTFLHNGKCELFGTGYEPLECRYCHHDRRGMGTRCHLDIGKDWNGEEGRALVVLWSKQTDFWNRLKFGTSRVP